MRSGTFSYLSMQGIKSLLKNKLMTFASIGVLASCLFLVGASAVLSVNIDNIIKYAEEQNEIVVFMDDMTEEEKAVADGKIKSLPGATDIIYVSKEEALEEQMASLGSSGALLEGLKEDNPLPDSYRIKISHITSLSHTVELLEEIDGIIKVNAPSNLAETLASIRQTVLILGISIVAVLILVTMIVIGNTIKLTVFARSREINIMKQVGATNAFIRFPFMVEGSMLGLLSALFAFLAVFGGYSYVFGLAQNGSNSWMSAVCNNLIPFSTIWWWLLIMFVFIGVITGIISTIVSVRKHLKV
jgi:cell division transport system permease protein